MGKHCEHGITPVTACLVCVSPTTGAGCPHEEPFSFIERERACCQLPEGHDGPHLVDAGILAVTRGRHHRLCQDYEILLAERDALRAEVERLRGVVREVTDLDIMEDDPSRPYVVAAVARDLIDDARGALGDE